MMLVHQTCGAAMSTPVLHPGVDELVHQDSQRRQVTDGDDRHK